MPDDAANGPPPPCITFLCADVTFVPVNLAVLRPICSSTLPRYVCIPHQRFRVCCLKIRLMKPFVCLMERKLCLFFWASLGMGGIVFVVVFASAKQEGFVFLDARLLVGLCVTPGFHKLFTGLVCAMCSVEERGKGCHTAHRLISSWLRALIEICRPHSFVLKLADHDWRPIHRSITRLEKLFERQPTQRSRHKSSYLNSAKSISQIFFHVKLIGH